MKYDDDLLFFKVMWDGGCVITLLIILLGYTYVDCRFVASKYTNYTGIKCSSDTYQHLNRSTHISIKISSRHSNLVKLSNNMYND